MNTGCFSYFTISLFFFTLPSFLCAQTGKPTSLAPSFAENHHGDFDEEFTHNGRTIRVFCYRPKSWNKDPVLVLFHGANRAAESYRRNSRILADQLNMLLLVPEFDRDRFDPQAFQEGGVFVRDQLQQRKDRTFTYVPALLEKVNRRFNRKLPYYLVGHSAGAQFVARLAATFPTDAKRIIAVNPSALVLPDRSENYPFGFGRLPENESSDEALQRYLATPLTLYLGTSDTDVKDLDQRPGAMRQGPNRIERGRRVYTSAKSLARERGWPFRWTLIEAEGLGHGSLPMWQHPKMKSAILGADK